MSYERFFDNYKTYISLEVIHFDVRFGPHQVAKHPSHHIFPEYNNLLAKKLDTTRVARKVHSRYLRFQARCKTRKNRAPWKDSGGARIVRARDEYKMTSTGKKWVRSYQIGQAIEIICTYMLSCSLQTIK